MRIITFLLAGGLSLGVGAPLAPAVAAPAARPPLTPLAVRKYLVYFRDKAASPYSVALPQQFLSARSIQRRTRQGIAIKPRDLPVNPTYVAQLRAVAGVQVWYTSRWLNAAVVVCDDALLPTLLALPCVRASSPLTRDANTTTPRKLEPEEPARPPATAKTTANPADYGSAYGQAAMLGVPPMHDAGYRGEGMQIAVLDAGFPGVDTAAPFALLFSQNRVASVFNFVDKSASVYLRDSHGTNTLSTMGGNQAGVFRGTAPNATFRLLITEDTNSENPIEEANWLIAAEYADSCGVDVISSSLGYNTFDNTTLSHTYADLDGRTTIATRAATGAARVGMLVLNSAGNDGNVPWHYISAPADADSILSVGSVTAAGLHSSFSSYGPTADGRLKPDLAAQGSAASYITSAGGVTQGSGTSFACPILAGMAAGFWQANPALTAQQVIAYLKQSGSQAQNPDNTLGYGIPNFVTAYNLAHPTAPLAALAAATLPQLHVYPNPNSSATGDLTLDLPTELQNTALQVRFYDVRGALVAEQQLAPNPAPTVALRPGPLKQGVYTCTVQSAKVTPRALRFVQL